MSNLSRLFVLSGVLLCSLGLASNVRAAHGDPPGRVARLNHIQGEVSYSPAGEDQWFGVVRNRPLVRGDRLWTDRDARAELQMGSAAVRLGPDSSFEILELDDRIAQVQLTQGTISLRVRRLYRGQSFEVATPTLAFTINRAGRYRIDVDPEYDETTIVVWEGAGEAYGENSSFPLNTGDTVRFYDADLRDYEMYALPRPDSFDRYSLARDLRLDRSASLRYLDDDVVGYADLDEYGSWRQVRSYGNVWFPNRVDSDWAPYRDGHWVWQEPWGWTWVDSAPWGFAPSHYGRWVSVSNRWGWIPGPRNVRPIYAPALVAFVGGSNWSVSLSLRGRSPIGWFPLGPREVYVPSYQVSRNYFTQVNVNNTVINNTTITNIYNNYASGNTNVSQVNYANRSVAGGITAVPGDVFANARSVRQAAIRLDSSALSTGDTIRIAPIAPNMRSVLGAGRASGARPELESFNREVIARSAPPPEANPFSMREKQLQKNPGRALEPRAGVPAQSGHANAHENVRVLSQRNAMNAREAGSSRDDVAPAAQGGQPPQLLPLDRSAESTGDRGRRQDDRGRDRDDGKADDNNRGGGDRRDAQLPPGRTGQGGRQQQAIEQQDAVDQQRVDRQSQDKLRQLERRQRQSDSKQQEQMQQQQQQQAQRDQRAAEQRQADLRQEESQRQVQAQQRAQRDENSQREQQNARDLQVAQTRLAEQQRLAEAQRQADAQQLLIVQQQQQALAQQQAQTQAQQQALAQQQAQAQAQLQAEQDAARKREEQERADAEAVEPEVRNMLPNKQRGRKPDKDKDKDSADSEQDKD